MIDMKELLAFAVEQNASDIHIAVGIPPKLRINGRLTEVELPAMTPADAAEAIGSTMHDRHKQILKERGEVDFSFASPETGRFRVNVFMDRGNMAAAYRKVDTIIPRPDQLGIPEAVVQLYKKKRGLVLVTGPTGSGKSTTLASIINKANENLTDHIITLEDPIEYIHKHKKSVVNQREVGMDTLSYANALRAALREDPDIILVGEMRDLETISTAITAAETGQPGILHTAYNWCGIYDRPYHRRVPNTSAAADTYPVSDDSGRGYLTGTDSDGRWAWTSGSVRGYACQPGNPKLDS